MNSRISNNDLLDAITALSFMIGIANYNENLTQSDKNDLLHELEKQTQQIVGKIEESLDYQNKMLERIIELLEGNDDASEKSERRV